MLNISLTFDYELFFNDSFASEKEVLIRPADEICKALNECGVKATFFIDVPSVFCYNRLNMKEYPQMVEEQIKRMIEMGHDVQLHFHPIWYKSTVVSGKWTFDNSYYRVQQFRKDELNLKEELFQSKTYLEKICKEVNSDYKCIGFRAGGFCVQPEEGFLDVLYDIGIRVDSSVLMLSSMDTESINYNFKVIPKQLGWTISPNTGVSVKSENRNEMMFEIPVGTYKKFPQKVFLTHFGPKVHYPPLKGRLSPSYTSNTRFPLIRKVKSTLRDPIQFSLDSLHYEALFSMTKKFAKQRHIEGYDNYVAALGHPKFCRGNYCENLKQYVLRVKEEKLPVEFVTIRDVYDKTIKIIDRK